MGSGIAQVAATAGYATVVREVAEAPLAKGKAGIVKSLDKFVEKGKMTQADRDRTLGRLSYVTDVAALATATSSSRRSPRISSSRTTSGSSSTTSAPRTPSSPRNTSSLTIAAMAAATKRADRFVGLHFFNPVPLMQLVEVVRTVTTSAAAFDRAFAFAKSLGKEAVAAKDNSGFIVNLLLVPYLLDAIRALEYGVASTTDIDNAMKLGCGYPMGPLTLLDFVGLDTTYKIAGIMFDEYREKRYAPPPLLKRMVMAGMYGRKSGKGFYDYSVNPATPVDLGL